MKRKVLIPIIVIALSLLVLIIYSARSSSEKALSIFTKTERGNFDIIVAITGELRAKNSTEIRAPSELRSRNLRVRSVKIQSLIPEGTVVDSGDWVATLDRTEVDLEFKDILDEVEQLEARYLRTQLDTTIQLRQFRDDLINMRYTLEEMEITLEQSKFEPPATIRQAQINLDKAQRAYEQAQTNYKLKVEQAKASMVEVMINLEKSRRRQIETESIMKQFEIKAPAPGMVIYKREYSGAKRTVGSDVSTYDLVVAELPDLSAMNSRTFVNEIDVSKIKIGQRVNVGVDAFPDKKYSGIVTSVANIGEQLPSTDAKVFEVIIQVNERDDILRPSMTTSNQIVTQSFENVLYIPLEAVHTNDSLTYVFKKNGVRQVVLLGLANENNIIVEKGLDVGEDLYLSVPSEPESFRFTGMELMAEINQRKLEQENREIDRRDRQETRPMRNPGGENHSREGRPRSGQSQQQ
jgi:HlyD family secretion protein